MYVLVVSFTHSTIGAVHMEATLVADVQAQIFRDYARAYMPMVARACGRWRTWVLNNGDPLFRRYPKCTRYSIIDVVRDGNRALVQWVGENHTAHCFYWEESKRIRIISVAARCGHDAIVTLCLNVWKWPLGWVAFRNAVRGGHADLIQKLEQSHAKALDANTNTYIGCWLASDELMLYAARGGHEVYVRRYHALNHSNTNLSDIVFSVMERAARGGHMHIMRICFDEWGATKRFFPAMLAAARGGHEHVVRFLHDTYENCRDRMAVAMSMTNAARGGHVQLVRVCHDEWGATSVNTAMECAFEFGHVGLARMCRDMWGAKPDLNKLMKSAAANGDEDGIRICIEEWSATDMDDVMAAAAEKGHEHIVRLCKEKYGADDFESARCSAARKHHDQIVSLCDAWIFERDRADTPM